MNARTGNFEGAKGHKLHFEVNSPAGPARAMLAMTHGMGEHAGRYTHLVGYLCKSGFATIGFDLRGHGRSAGRRGHIDSWADYREDQAAFLKLVRKEYPGIPLFVYGHSLGSLIVLDYALENPPELRGAKGMILSALPIQPANVAGPAQVAMAKVLSRLSPAMEMKSEDLSNRLSRDPAVGKAYREDPLVMNKFTVRWADESLKVVDSIKRRPARLDVPVLFIHGSADAIAVPGAAKAYFDSLRAPDKSMRIYPDSFHEVHNDLDNAQAASDIAEWMNKHLDR